ncbi:MAG: hypothetical protein HRF44_05465 [Ignavibacterium sp.]
MDASQVLQRLHFGRVDAESDYRLSQCFVGTEMLRHALTPQHSLFIGPKGSGKSALFRLLCNDLSPWKSLLPKGYEVIFRIPATGLQSERYLSGVDLDELSPATANDFRAFWLLYIGLKTATTLVEDQRMQTLVEHSANPRVKQNYATLARVVKILGLVEGSTVEKLKQRIDNLMEGEDQNDPAPAEVAKALSVNFRNRTGMAIISLLDVIDVLLQDTRCLSWILLDKLDLLFFDDVLRLRQSITGLVQLLVEYSDRFRNIHFKVFLRRDIYRELRIVNKSHLVSYTNEMKWRGPWLVKLLAARAVSDPVVQAFCEGRIGEKADVSAVINGSDEFVLKVFYSIFEKSMGVVRRDRIASPTHSWILKRVVDGLGMGFPREMIHLGNVAVQRQKELNRTGTGNEEGRPLLSSRALRLAFDAVSEYRCETYLNAEFPHLRRHVDLFRGRETSTILKSDLVKSCEHLDPSGEEAVRVLHDVGLLQPVGKNPDSALKFEIPMLYRNGLGIVERRGRRGRLRKKPGTDRESVAMTVVPKKESVPVDEINIPFPHTTETHR